MVEDLDALALSHQRVGDAGSDIEGLADHTVSQSILLKDTDGNQIELYLDDTAIDWRHDRDWLNEPANPLY